MTAGSQVGGEMNRLKARWNRSSLGLTLSKSLYWSQAKARIEYLRLK